MLLSEAIEKLTKIKEEHGDLLLACWPYDGQGKMLYEASGFNININQVSTPYWGKGNKPENWNGNVKSWVIVETEND